jgi:hypothetical protein
LPLAGIKAVRCPSMPAVAGPGGHHKIGARTAFLGRGDIYQAYANIIWRKSGFSASIK